MDDGKALGNNDGTELGVIEGNTDGVEDGSVLIDGILDGEALGTNDGQTPHVALQVWKTPVTLQFSSLAIVHVLYSSSNINST